MKLTQSVLAEMKNAINIVLGLESAFAFINSVQEFYHFVITLQNAVGNRHRRAFYIVNRDLLQYLEYNPLPEFERIATTVAEAVQVPDGSILTFKKLPTWSSLERALGSFRRWYRELQKGVFRAPR